MPYVPLKEDTALFMDWMIKSPKVHCEALMLNMMVIGEESFER